MVTLRGADRTGLSPPTTATALIGIIAIALWGAFANAVSPMLQAAAMRAGADDPDGASGLYMAAFQVGIMAGSLAGGLFYEHGVLAMLAASAVLMGIAAGRNDAPTGTLRRPRRYQVTSPSTAE